MSEPNGCTIPMIFSLIALVLAPLFGVVLNESGLDLASSGPCIVQAEHADVAVRVGPGLHRAIRIYLPTNRAFPVIGKATAGDGSLWWKVDIAGIEQAWVAQSDVAAAGGCALVADVDAPPVILAPPTVAPLISPAETGAAEEPVSPPESSPQGPVVCVPQGSCDNCVVVSGLDLLSPEDCPMPPSDFCDACAAMGYPPSFEPFPQITCYDSCGNVCDFFLPSVDGRAVAQLHNVHPICTAYLYTPTRTTAYGSPAHAQCSVKSTA